MTTRPNRKSPGVARPRLTPEQVARLRVAYVDGVPLVELERRFKIGAKTLRELVAESGVAP